MFRSLAKTDYLCPDCLLQFYNLFHSCYLAAFAYAFAEKRFDGYRLLVFDFGGGTFDVSVVKVEEGRFRVLHVEGDSNLGGRDLDEELFKYCAEEIRRQWNKDCKSNPRIKQELLEMCEDLKIDLSTRDVARFFVFKYSY